MFDDAFASFICFSYWGGMREARKKVPSKREIKMKCWFALFVLLTLSCCGAYECFTGCRTSETGQNDTTPRTDFRHCRTCWGYFPPAGGLCTQGCLYICAQMRIIKCKHNPCRSAWNLFILWSVQVDTSATNSAWRVEGSYLAKIACQLLPTAVAARPLDIIRQNGKIHLRLSAPSDVISCISHKSLPASNCDQHVERVPSHQMHSSNTNHGCCWKSNNFKQETTEQFQRNAGQQSPE